jgi:glycosyl transferase, family 25
MIILLKYKIFSNIITNITMSKNYLMYYINLDKRERRRIKFEEEIEKQQLNITRFSAIDGCNLKIQHAFLKKGEYGCFSSHYNLWDEIKNLNTSSIIFEDDIIFCENFSDKLQIILDESKELDYDIILLSHNWYQESKKIPITENISSIGPFHGTQGYIISPNAAEKLSLEFKDDITWTKPLDIFFSELVNNDKLKLFSTNEKLVILSSLSNGSDTNRN